jgi:hypothetical protein
MTNEPETQRLTELINTLTAMAHFDPRSLFDTNNSLKPVQLWPREAALAVSAITSRELFAGSGQDRVLIGVEHTVKLSDRTKALELSLRELGAFADRIPPPSDPSQMTDAELIRTVEYHLVDGHTASKWEAMSDAQVIEDYRRITEAFDRRCPGARIPDPAPPQRPPGAQLALPAPVTIPAPEPAPEPPAAPEEPIDDPPPSINDWRQRRYASPHLAAFDAYAQASQAHGSITYNFPPRK